MHQILFHPVPQVSQARACQVALRAPTNPAASAANVHTPTHQTHPGTHRYSLTPHRVNLMLDLIKWPLFSPVQFFISRMMY